MPWRQAIITVLEQSGEAMHYTDIAEQIAEQGLRTTFGAIPAATVNAQISGSIKNDGEESRFFRAGQGLYGLKTWRESADPVDPLPPNEVDQIPEKAVQDSGVVRALGMYWLRSNVMWKSNPNLLGRQQLGADPVDFSHQRGVYLLYDGRDVIYVGRSTERPLGQRLFEHTYDRLNGRWDRFSWFGLYPVTEDGKLNESIASKFSIESAIAAFEAILIESLEPPQNRRRGDNLTAVEFMQARDPELEKRQMKSLLEEMLHKFSRT